MIFHWVLLLIALAQPKHRLISCTIVSAFALVHDILCSSLPGESYFLTSALASLLTILALNKLVNKTPFVIILQQIIWLFIVIDFIGWVLYEAYFEPYYYTTLCAILYMYLMYRMLKRDDGGFITVGLGIHRLYLHCVSVYRYINSQLQHNKE